MIVILSEKSRDYVLNQIKSTKENCKNKINLIIKEGNPLSKATLNDISIQKASNIVIVNREDLDDGDDENKAIDIDQVIDDFYNYIYIVIKNSVNITITDEDIEEIISDVFVALWKNYDNLNETLDIKAYLVGISKNIIKWFATELTEF